MTWRSKRDHQFKYVLREDNKLVDYFTNVVFYFAGTIQFNNFQDLPTEAKRLIKAKKESKS